MRKTIKLAVVAALALGATSAFATNGDVMIGQGAKARSMGGVGIAKSFGAESGLVNPAMIASVEKSEATLVVTAFAPKVSFGSNAGSNAGAAVQVNAAAIGASNPGAVVAGPNNAIVMGDSGSNLSIIPEIAYATRLTDNTVVGLSVSGTAGMGVDYGTDTTNGSFKMKTALSLLKVAVPVSYQVGGFTVGVEGVLQYGTLQMSHDTFSTPVDNGIASDIGYGIEVGASYTTNGLTLGAVYKSKIGMTYDKTIASSVTAFGGAAATGIASGDNLDQPEERGVGISYVMGSSTLSADYKNIAWGDAAGYKDFGWENQDVYAVGYEFAAKSWAFRMGYNYAKSPIVEQDGSQYAGAVKNFFNLSGFPGIVDTHYTIGGAYSFSDALSLDAAFIYVPEVSASFNTTGLSQGAAYQLAGGATPYTNTPANNTAGAVSANTQASSANVTHSQMGLTLAMSYRF